MTKKQSSKSNSKFGAKAAFIRSMPTTMTAREVVAEAAKQGLKITEGHVYNLRSTKQPKKATTITVTDGAVAEKRGPGRPRKHANGNGASVASLGQETDLRRAIAELGLSRARAVFAEVEAAFIGR